MFIKPDELSSVRFFKDVHGIQANVLSHWSESICLSEGPRALRSSFPSELRLGSGLDERMRHDRFWRGEVSQE